jgi:hypothetical protein
MNKFKIILNVSLTTLVVLLVDAICVHIGLLILKVEPMTLETQIFGLACIFVPLYATIALIGFLISNYTRTRRIDKNDDF